MKLKNKIKKIFSVYTIIIVVSILNIFLFVYGFIYPDWKGDSLVNNQLYTIKIAHGDKISTHYCTSFDVNKDKNSITLIDYKGNTSSHIVLYSTTYVEILINPKYNKKLFNFLEKKEEKETPEKNFI